MTSYIVSPGIQWAVPKEAPVDSSLASPVGAPVGVFHANLIGTPVSGYFLACQPQPAGTQQTWPSVGP